MHNAGNDAAWESLLALELLKHYCEKYAQVEFPPAGLFGSSVVLFGWDMYVGSSSSPNKMRADTLQ